MAEVQNNKPLLHKKEWQTMTPAPTATVTGAFVIADKSDVFNVAMYVVSATVQYLYHHNEDSWVQAPSGALGGTFGAGATGIFRRWSNTYTANGGSTTTVTVNPASFNINGYTRGETIEFQTGDNAGVRATITEIRTDGGIGTITLTLDTTLTSPVANGDTFRVTSGRFFVFNAGTLSATSFKVFDLGTFTWTALSVTGLPATWGTDGRMAAPYRLTNQYSTVATPDIFSSTSIGLSTKTWTIDQWINYQVRITAGTGIGQRRKITDSTATTLTVASWTTTPDATSSFVIEGDQGAIFLLGNNAVTMYKYDQSANTWATVAPTVARANAPGIGMSADFVDWTGDTGWGDENNILDGQYIYSVQGGATANIHRFKISGGTNGAGAWSTVNYIGTETFTTGASATVSGRYVYIIKEGSATVPCRVFKYTVRGNYLEPVATDWYLGGAALLGNKSWVKALSTDGTIKWLYVLQSTSTTLRRIMLF